MAFSLTESKSLQAYRGIGPSIVQRLEQAGFDSIEQLASVGAPAAVLAVCEMMGTIAWANRRRALERALVCAVGR